MWETPEEVSAGDNTFSYWYKGVQSFKFLMNLRVWDGYKSKSKASCGSLT